MASSFPTLLPIGEQSRDHFRCEIEEQACHLHDRRMAEIALRPQE